MIPLKLTLRNFMSYGEEPAILDFTGIHVASLSGDNGNGKSAILDAMTYALWGATRASGSSASNEDDLIRLSAEDMEVVFDFEQDGAVYRVIRKRSRKTRAGEWTLLMKENDGRWRPIGGGNMRETSRLLARLLHMEYDTFQNSAYIQQGHADEFTRQKPNERKRILAEILDLSRYDRLEQMSRERRSETDLLLKDLDGELRVLKETVSTRFEVETRLAQHEKAQGLCEAIRLDRQKELQALHERLASQNEIANMLEQMRNGRLRDENRLNELNGVIRSLQEQIKQAKDRITLKQDVQKKYIRLQEIRKQSENLRTVIYQLNNVRTEHATLTVQLEGLRKQLESDFRSDNDELQRAEARQQLINENYIAVELINARLKDAETLSAQEETARKELEEVQLKYSELFAQNDTLNRDIAEIEEVLQVLALPKSLCPVCQSDLSGGRQEAVIQRQQARKAELHLIRTRVREEGATAKQDRTIRQKNLDVLQKQLQILAGERSRLDTLLKQIEQDKREMKDISAIRERLSKKLNDLKHESFGQVERTRIANLEQQLKDLNELEKQQKILALEEKTLSEQNLERRMTLIEQAELNLEIYEKELAEKQLRVNSQQATIKKALEGEGKVEASLSDFEDLKQNTIVKQRLVNESVAECDREMTDTARCRQQLEHCDQCSKLVEQKEEAHKQLSNDMVAWKELSVAFSKQGVQALIIDNVLPEIQDEANRLLARMTDNAMQVALTTSRPSRSGKGQIETLDISITDDAGPRPYEMFSGGEAFRINFALRIALSRLLAHRAGASLSTLFLDEGFGTQDAKGRERLVEAIEAVKEEFSLILVISHIEELKDAFPTRIEVIKTAAGSQINMME